MNNGIQRVGNVFYFADDLTAAIDWYTTLLGTTPVDVHRQLAAFDVAGTRLTVHISDEYNRPAFTAGAVSYWDVDDLDWVVGDCVRRGGEIHRGPKKVFTGETLCQVLDPFGNLIGFREPPQVSTVEPSAPGD
ncbi:VOC family protein [Rhodococcus sp. P1Y]|uniref:VOC family protein n=1 Tax=Rhodococcus sp. P1Y TaxID=1302308 RepID=UPI00137B2316|nr:VOC family protein [Rhodococcus sp. P1Y]